jgi:outer membrane murein-binding lipoprotein Lpp
VRTVAAATIAVAMLLLAGCGGDSGQTADLGDELQAANEKIAQLEADLFNATSTTTEAAASTTTTAPVEPSTGTTATAFAETTTTTSIAGGGEPLGPQASPFVGGTFVDELPPGIDSELSVILEGTHQDGSVPLIIRNLTEESVIGIEVNGIARDQDGGLVSSGSSQGFSPQLVAPGEIAYGYVYFGYDVDLSNAASYEWSVTATSSTDQFAPGFADLVPVEWSSVGDNIVVLLSNDTDAVITGPISVDAACFDASGVFVGTAGTFADGDTVQPGASVAGQFSPYEIDCDQYLVAGSGYDY